MLRRLKTSRPLLEGQEIILIFVIVIIWAAMGVLTPTFLDPASAFDVFYGVAPIAIMALAMTPIMCTAGIDVSVGSMMAVVMVVVGKLLRDLEVNAIVAIAIGILVGAVLGAINASLICFGRIPAMVCTFGTLNIFRYVALQIFGDTQVSGVPSTLGFIGGSINSSLLGLPNAMWLALVLTVLVWFYMRNFATGRHIYAIGNDINAARLAGVKVNKRLFWLYTASGIAAGLAALISIGNGGLIQQNVGVGMEMSVIAACVIGGTSVLGGRGTVAGTLLGAILVGSVQAAAIHLHLPSSLTQLFVGIIIIIAVGVDLYRQARRSRP